jgi:hypothetical protein
VLQQNPRRKTLLITGFRAPEASLSNTQHLARSNFGEADISATW